MKFYNPREAHHLPVLSAITIHTHKIVFDVTFFNYVSVSSSAGGAGSNA